MCFSITRSSVLGILLLVCLPVHSQAAKTAFRITDMDWREPHTFVDVLGCRDVTDTAFVGFSMNPWLQSQIQGDADTDGKLDLSYVITFDPLDQPGAGGTLTFGYMDCAAPHPTSLCAPGPYLTVSASYTNMAATCLDALAGTTWAPYVIEIAPSGPPCFVANLGTFSFVINDGLLIRLTDLHIAATYSGAPATNLVSGLIRGFISETDANNTIIPPSTALIGGLPLASMFPGGDPPGPSNTCCAAHSDKDVGPGGVMGWYVYFNFTAAAVPVPTAVGDARRAGLMLDEPHPNPFNPSSTLRYSLPAAARVNLAIYDANGRVVTTLVDDEKPKGDHVVTWDGRDARGGVASSGVYFIRLTAGAETRTRKIVLLK